MDFIAMAETLEAQAAALRREHARQEQEGQPSLELDAPPVAGEWKPWEGGDGPPADVSMAGAVADVRLRDGYEMTGPAGALTWSWEHNAESHPENSGLRDIVEYRRSAEQPAE